LLYKIFAGFLYNDQILGKMSLSDTILLAAQEIYNEALAQGLEKHLALSRISVDAIAVVAQTSRGAVGTTLGRMYVQSRETLGAQGIEDITNTALLRVAVFESKHGKSLVLNFTEARKTWGPEVRFTKYDLLRGIKLPSTITPEVAYLAGYLQAVSKGGEGGNVIYLNPNRKNSEITGIIKMLFEDLFNYGKYEKLSKGDDSRVVSGAIYTFLHDVLGVYDEEIAYFGEQWKIPHQMGYLAGGASSSMKPKTLRFAFANNQEGWRQAYRIQEYFEIFEPRLPKAEGTSRPQPVVRFPADSIRRLVEQKTDDLYICGEPIEHLGMLTNPRHIRDLGYSPT
jgi:hypothetical protein